MATVTLEEYLAVERETEVHGARIGFAIHAAVTLLVWLVLVPINIFVAPQFPWSAFVVAGMAIGLFLHWWTGFRDIEASVERRQGELEHRALVRSGRG